MPQIGPWDTVTIRAVTNRAIGAEKPPAVLYGTRRVGVLGQQGAGWQGQDQNRFHHLLQLGLIKQMEYDFSKNVFNLRSGLSALSKIA
jgi:hypothetical protein